MGRLATLIMLGLLAQSCAPSDNPSDLYPAADGEFSVLSITLPALGTPDFFEKTLQHWLTQDPPDLCIIQRLPSKAALAQIARADQLKHYSQTWSSPAADGSLSLLLSQTQPQQVVHHDQASYTVKGDKENFQHAPMEILLQAGKKDALRCIIAPLRAKNFHPSGQSEMRRNEARLLGRIVAHPPEEWGPHHTILLSSFMDHPNSDAMDKLTSQKGWELVDALPLDIARGAWTFYDAQKESCHRYDYQFTNPALAQRRIIGKCKIPTWLSPGQLESGHRPLYTVYALSP